MVSKSLQLKNKKFHENITKRKEKKVYALIERRAFD
jgi:hypothetical protein